MLTVIVPPGGRQLIAPSVALAELGAPDTALDSMVRMVNQASRTICGECNRVFGRRTVTETLRAAACSPVLLSTTMLLSIQSVTMDGAALMEADYDADLDAGTIALYRCGSAAVTYVAGWILPDDPAFEAADPDDQLPEDVQRAALVTVSTYWHARGRDPLLRSHSTDGVSSMALFAPAASSSALPPEAVGLLSRYVVHGK